MLRPIVLYGAEVLAKPSQPVTQISGAEVQLVKDMIETMYKAPGVGLAAPQVGIGQRIMVTDPSAGEKRNQLITIVNPEIIESEGEQTEDEGCLSIPGFREEVSRAKKALVHAVNVEGEPVEITGEDLLARALQHEIDHLNGVLFLTHLSPLKRDLIRRKIKKMIKAGEW